MIKKKGCKGGRKKKTVGKLKRKKLVMANCKMNLCNEKPKAFGSSAWKKNGSRKKKIGEN